MARFALDQFAPDRASFDRLALAVALNTLPVDDGYGPFPGVALEGNEPITDNVIRDVIEYEYDGVVEVFVGTTEKLWRKSGDTWINVTRSVGGLYDLGDTDFWSFATFGSFILAFNGRDDPQKFDLASSTNFEELGGNPGQGVAVAIHRDFVFFFVNTGDGQCEVWWSGINNPEIYDGTNLSDIQPLPDGGPGKAIINAGDALFLFQERKVHRFIYNSNPDIVFTRDEVEVGRGCVGPKAAAADNGVVFYLAHDGFYSIASNLAVEGIGSGFVNQFFFDRCAIADRPLTVATVDPGASRILFVYRSTAAGAEPYDEILIYDWRLKKWSFARIPLQWLFSTSVSAWTLEDLEEVYGNLEDVPEPLSSRRWKAGSDILGIFDPDGYQGALIGANMEATFETSTMVEPENVMKMAGRLKPIVDTREWVGSVGTVQELGDTVEWSSDEPPNLAGWSKHRVAGKGIRFRVKVSEGATWSGAQAISFETQPPYAPSR